MEELFGEMNISNGALVATLASADPAWATRTAAEIRAFKVGTNQLRCRGDRAEVFGGLGESWKGAFVGGKLLVEAVTHSRPASPCSAITRKPRCCRQRYKAARPARESKLPG